MAVRGIVSNNLTNTSAYEGVQNLILTARNLDEADRPPFVTAVETPLNWLSPDTLPGYGLDRSEFDRWAPSSDLNRVIGAVVAEVVGG